jgi:hypothetical protein
VLIAYFTYYSLFALHVVVNVECKVYIRLREEPGLLPNTDTGLTGIFDVC